jgi:hypothetical protein
MMQTKLFFPLAVADVSISDESPFYLVLQNFDQNDFQPKAQTCPNSFVLGDLANAVFPPDFPEVLEAPDASARSL